LNAGNELTFSELQVLTLLCKGCSYKKIQDTLHISEGTVNTHIKNIYSKLNVNNKVEGIRKQIK
jgi:DNA-binding NarL/FixJ family response regulator